MQNIIKELKDITRSYGSSYHDWVIRASKDEIMKVLGIKPKYNKSGYKTHYDWHLILNDDIIFTIYDMSYGRALKKDSVIEYHIGWGSNDWDWDTYKKYEDNYPEIIDALKSLGLDVDRSDSWKSFYGPGGTFETVIKPMIHNDDKY